MRLFRVKYNFRAEDEGELTVRRGDLLRVSSSSSSSGQGEDELTSKHGWTLVETLSPPFARGYVPTNYIEKAETPTSRSLSSSPMNSPRSSASRPHTAGSAAGSERSSRQPTASEKSPTRASRLAPIRRLSDPRLPQHLLETLETSDGAPVSPEASPMPAPPPQQQQQYKHQQPYQSQQGSQQRYAMPSEVALESRGPTAGSHVDLNKLFAAHDQWLDQVMEERERDFASFENSVQVINDALTRVREKSQDVVSKVMSLDAQVESQRQQLKQRIEEDNKSINSRFAQLYA